MLRANLKSSKISVIPNAVDSYSFTPDTTLRPSSSDESIKIKQIIIIICCFLLSCYYCCQSSCLS
jgi:hypothetical protein